MILLLLTIAATLCTFYLALAAFTLVLCSPKGGARKAVYSTFLYPVPVIVILWILYANVP